MRSRFDSPRAHRSEITSMKQKKFSNIILILVAVILLGGLVYLASLPRSADNQGGGSEWQRYERSFEDIDSSGGFVIDYPAGWSAMNQEGARVSFAPLSETNAVISLTVSNYRETPPPPIFYTYTNIRTIAAPIGEMVVQSREPGLPDDYYVIIPAGDLVAEFRFTADADRRYSSTFDHMIASFSFAG